MVSNSVPTPWTKIAGSAIFLTWFNLADELRIAYANIWSVDKEIQNENASKAF